MAYKSPGVLIEEFKLNFSKRTPSSIRAAFAGNFQKGPVGEAIAITTDDELIQTFGVPTEANYNDWFQVRNFIKYYPGIFVTRAANLDHDYVDVIDFPGNITITRDKEINSFDLNNGNPYSLSTANMEKLRSEFRLYDRFTIEGDNAENNRIYTVMDVNNFTFTPALRNDVFAGNNILKLNGVITASIEMPTEEQFRRTPSNAPNGLPANEPYVESPGAFEMYKDSFSSNNFTTPLSVWARSPGSWGNQLQVAIVFPSDFRINYSASDTRQARLAFDGVVVDHIFRQAPTGDQIGVIVALGNNVVEHFVVRPNHTEAGDFIEDVINARSQYILVKRGIGELYSTAFDVTDIHRPLRLIGGMDSEIGVEDIERATKVFEDNETYEFDVIIANELDAGISAINLAMKRKDIVAVVGAGYDNFGSKNPAKIVDNLVDWREHIYTTKLCDCCTDSPKNLTDNAIVLNTSYAVFVGNYLSIYDHYNRKQRLINIAGDIAGLRCATNDAFGEWRASAGVNRGVLSTESKLVFNPPQEHRDVMYTHNINPVVALNGVGNVLWGNRTLADLDDDFLSWHVRSMVNMMSRNISKTCRRFLMDNVNSYTMQAVISSLQPLMHTVQSGGGLLDYYIMCDQNNNPPEALANNELTIDVFIRPTGVAEFIRIRLMNSGAETFTTIIDKYKFQRK